MSIYLLNKTQFSYIIRRINLTKSELRKIFSVKTEFALTEKTTLKTRALLQSTSIIYNFVDPKHIAAKMIAKFFITPSFPGPEKDPYWIIKKRGILVNAMNVAKIWMSTGIQRLMLIITTLYKMFRNSRPNLV